MMSTKQLPRCIATLLVLFFANSCSRTPPPPSDPAERSAYWKRLDAEYETLVRGYDADTGARQIRVDQLREKIAAGEKILLLDIREAREHQVSSLPAARHIAPDDVAAAKIDAADDVTIVAYCTAGYRSGMAAVELEKKLGREVLNLHGGIVAWFNAGGEVRDPGGKAVDKIDAYGPDWEKYVHPRD